MPARRPRSARSSCRSSPSTRPPAPRRNASDDGRSQVSELQDRRVAIEDQLSRTDVGRRWRAIQRAVGSHDQQRDHAGGAAHHAGAETPRCASRPYFAGRHRPGQRRQPARLLFSAFNRNSAPELPRKVVYVSPDDPRYSNRRRLLPCRCRDQSRRDGEAWSPQLVPECLSSLHLDGQRAPSPT